MDNAVKSCSQKNRIAGLFGAWSEIDHSLTSMMEKVSPPSSLSKKTFSSREMGLAQLRSEISSSQCGRFYLLFDGQLYNRKELEGLLNGSDLSHVPDGEVVLAAYLLFGKKFLSHLQGPFALCIVDELKKEYFVARDRFGMKPLYYWKSRGKVAFASEIKQFLPLPTFQRKLNSQRAYDFLNWGLLDHTEETLFQGVNQLRGGECGYGSIVEGTLTKEFWHTSHISPFTGTFEEGVEQFQSLFRQSVDLCSFGDEKMGVSLSGGLDSPSIAAFLKERRHFQTVSSCSEDPRYDERKYSLPFAKELEVENHLVFPQFKDLLQELDQMLWTYDEPMLSTSMFAGWKVFEKWKELGVKVVLEGHGADGLLAGDIRAFGHHWFELFKSKKWITLVKEMQASPLPYFGLLHLGGHLIPSCVENPFLDFFGKDKTAPNWIDLNVLEAEDKNPFQDLKRKSLEEWRETITFQKSLPALLHYQDRASTHHGVEVRNPFLDLTFADFTLSLPSPFLIKKGFSKYILREAMRSKLPDFIRLRKDKMGFVTPEKDWVKRPDFLQLLQKEISESSGIVKPDILRSHPFNFRTFRALSFLRWLKIFEFN